MSVVFVDCETTGLDPDRHEIWEVAIIYEVDHVWREVEYQLPVDLSRADPTGLRVGRFYERRSRIHAMADNYGDLCRVRYDGDDKWTAGLSADYYANAVARLLDGYHIVGAVPSFDAAFLTRWLNRKGQAATWHYHLIDVEALAVGFIADRGHISTLPWNSDQLSLAVGVDPDLFDRHTALGDARWAKAIYEAVMG